MWESTCSPLGQGQLQGVPHGPVGVRLPPLRPYLRLRFRKFRRIPLARRAAVHEPKYLQAAL